MMKSVRFALAVGLFVLAGPGIASAMSPFAQSYRMRCVVSHTQVPALNAYGEVGYFGSSADLSGANDWSNANDKTLQFRVAHANPQQPLEYGVMGVRGSFPLAEGGYDQYIAWTPYIQRDPVGKMPGIFAMYQMAYDGNAG